MYSVRFISLFTEKPVHYTAVYRLCVQRLEVCIIRQCTVYETCISLVQYMTLNAVKLRFMFVSRIFIFLPILAIRPKDV